MGGVKSVSETRQYRSNWIERNQYYRPAGQVDGMPRYEAYLRPVIVCLCGSTRFREQFEAANEAETIAGKIVLSVGCFRRVAPDGQRPDLEEAVKQSLDVLHLEKINLADEVLILNVGGYVGESTRREVLHAKRTHKVIRWLEPDSIPDDLA